jgi:predicted transcriptional regulator
MTKSIDTGVEMSPALRERVARLAEIRSRTPHTIILQAIETWVDREEKREALRQAGIDAHEAFVRTGLHLTNEEFKNWLSKLADGNDAEPPRCHI